MKLSVRSLLHAFGVLHAVLALLFAAASVALIVLAAQEGFTALGEDGQESAIGLIQAIGIAAVAVVCLQIAQTIAEEEVIREAHVSGPTRVRRFLSRFLVVLVIALCIEALIGTFKALRGDMAQLPNVAALIAGVGVLIVGWGAFIWFNRSAELLEPEAMQQAKSEDRKLK